MPFGTQQRESTSIGVIWMALALAAAAFLGAALGLVWQSSGLGEEESGDEVTAGEQQD